MHVTELLRKIEQLEQRLNELEDENRRLREIETKYEELKKENAQLKLEIGQLKETLKQYADVKTAKKPTFDLNYSSQRNEPEDPNTKKKRKWGMPFAPPLLKCADGVK